MSKVGSSPGQGSSGFQASAVRQGFVNARLDCTHLSLTMSQQRTDQKSGQMTGCPVQLHSIYHS